MYDPRDERLGALGTGLDELQQLGTGHAETLDRGLDQPQDDTLDVGGHGRVDASELVHEGLVLGEQGQVEAEAGARRRLGPGLLELGPAAILAEHDLRRAGQLQEAQVQDRVLLDQPAELGPSVQLDDQLDRALADLAKGMRNFPRLGRGRTVLGGVRFFFAVFFFAWFEKCGERNFGSREAEGMRGVLEILRISEGGGRVLGLAISGIFW